MTERTRVLIPASPSSSYDILVGPGAIAELPLIIGRKSYSKVFIVTDETVSGYWLSDIQAVAGEATVISVPPGESHKSLPVLERIWGELLRGQADRRSLVLNLGGGVVGDMGGFAAATYMRGIDFAQIPTTLLAQVDASVGGKLAIDFHGAKNMVGVFAQPVAVVADTRTLATLPDSELVSGYAEVLKHGLIADATYFDHCSKQRVQAFSDSEMASIVARSVEIKAAIVERDEKETGERKLLNFGHTIGHAVESLSLEGMGERPFLHGEAVAFGMLAETVLAERIQRTDGEFTGLVRKALQLQGFPVLLNGEWDLDAICTRLLLDKKNTGGVVNWTLVTGKGKAEFDVQIPLDIVRLTLQELSAGGRQ